MRRLSVWVCDREVGVLQENPDSGTFDFAYLPDVPPALAVSLTMPVGLPAHEYQGFNRIPPPFEVSLPEGFVLEALRRRFAKVVDVDDDFALLQLVGRHTVGRVTFGGPLETDPSLERQILAAARTEGAARTLFEILKAHPQTTGISGVMPKMSHGHGDRSRHPGTAVVGGALVKFDTPEYPGAALVEFACLRACQAAGLSVPDIRLSPDASALTIARFDVAPDGARRGFEDACALSGLARHGKYRGTVQDLFHMIGHFMAPPAQAEARRELVRRLLANDLLRNGDAHLKNFGLVYDDPASPSLAPVFDVLTTTVWIPGDRPALRLAPDSAAAQWLDAAGLETLAALAEMPAESVRALHAELRARMLPALEAVRLQAQPTHQGAARAALDQALRDIGA